MRTRRTLCVLTVVALTSAVAVPASGPATASPRLASSKARTTVTISWPKPLTAIGSRVRLVGRVTPARPASARVALQRKISGQWRTVKRVKYQQTAGGTSFYNLATAKLGGGLKAFRVCAPATSTARRDCSPARRTFVGRPHALSTLTPVATTGGFSVGSLTVNRGTFTRSLRFVGTLDGSATYDLRRGCAALTGNFGIADDATGVVRARFGLALDGTSLGSADIGIGPVGFFDGADIRGARRLTLRTTVTVTPAPGDYRRGFLDPEVFCAW